MGKYDVLPRRIEHTLHCPPRRPVLEGEGGSTGAGTRPGDPGSHPYPALVRIALCPQYLATGTADGRIIIWPVSRRTPVDSIELGSTVQRVCDLSWSLDGRFLFAVVKDEGSVVLRVWEVDAHGNENITSEIGSVSIKASGDVKVEGCGYEEPACGRGVDGATTTSCLPDSTTTTPRKQGGKGATAADIRVTPNGSMPKKRQAQNAQGALNKGTPKKSKGTTETVDATDITDDAGRLTRALVTDVQSGELQWLVVKPSGTTYSLEMSPITLRGWETPRLVVGDRVEVFWKDNEPQPMWFAGSVGQVDPSRKRMFVFYDDGQALWEEWEGPEALEWRKEAPGGASHPLPSSSEPAEAAPPKGEIDEANLIETVGETIKPVAGFLAVRCGKKFDHLAVLDVPAGTLRLYARQGPDAFRLIDELKTNNKHKRPSHLAVSPNGRRLVVTHPNGNIFAFSVNTDDNVSSLESPNKNHHHEVMHLAMIGQLDWHSHRGKPGAKEGERYHTWHTCTFAPDSTHVFCSMTLDHEPKKHPIVIWDPVSNVNKRLLESSNNCVPHLVTSMCAHPHSRPMELFALNTSGLVVIWAPRLVQNWSVIEQGFESFEQNRLHIEEEDDFDVVEGGTRPDEVVQDEALQID